MLFCRLTMQVFLRANVLAAHEWWEEHSPAESDNDVAVSSLFAHEQESGPLSYMRKHLAHRFMEEVGAYYAERLWRFRASSACCQLSMSQNHHIAPLVAQASRRPPPVTSASL